MEYIVRSHRNAQVVFQYDPQYQCLYQEVTSVLEGIRDQDIVNAYHAITRRNKKSISEPINKLIKEGLVSLGWHPESAIFNDPDYTDTKWRLDFAKDKVSIEVAFNHGEAISWNLLKPVMASELNHIQKAVQTSAGIIICATEEMKAAGNFDRAVGTFEKFERYLTPMYNVLPSPLLLIGLKAPRSFYVDENTKQIVIYK